MKINPCIVIPVYNHGPQLKPVLEKLKDHGLPVILVNDGSNAETTGILDEAAALDFIDVIHREENGGKGAAVITGFEAANERGYSHVLQLDADGQHDLDDIPRFVEAAEQQPFRMIVGRAVYDETVPKIREYGRYLTHALVWLECLSFDLKDTMCGFRMYPLEPALRLTRSASIGKRMDFDMEIAVRLTWQGVRAINLDTKVRYAEDGVSHFRMFQDNVLISLMHTRLVIGMLLRLPVLVYHRFRPIEEGHWSERGERGSFFLLRVMLLLYRMGGKWLVRALIYPIILYFFLTSRKARRHSMQYLSNLHAFCPEALGHKPTWRDSLRHFLAFGQSTLERFSAWMGDIQRTDMNWPNKQILIDMLAQKQGGVLIGAHLGSLEILRGATHKAPELKFNALVFHQHAPRINRLLKMANPQIEINLIPVEEFTPDIAILLRDLVDRGEFVAILGERSPAGARKRVQYVPFLGKPAPFPEGPFILASLLKCPVFLIFCLRSKGSVYDVHLEPFEDDLLQLPRKNREAALKAAITRYARALEQQCCKAPYQWYNFYDFWNHNGE